jgi:hypothetical protein
MRASEKKPVGLMFGVVFSSWWRYDWRHPFDKKKNRSSVFVRSKKKYMREVDAVKLRCAGYEPPRNGTVAPSCGVMTEWDQMFVSSLARPPACRSLQDLQVIYYGLSGLEALQTLRDSALRALCKVVRYEKHQANDVLY